MFFKHLVTTIVLIFLVHLTRFENTADLEFIDGTARFTLHNNSYSLPAGDAKVLSVSALLQKSMLAESYVLSTLIESDGKIIYQNDRTCLYLFGYCILGDALSGKYTNFLPSYGDWTMDRFISLPLSIYEEKPPENFKLSVKLAGRGDKAIKFLLSDGKHITANISDGYMDNASSLCLNDDCSRNNFSEEPINLNLGRILNFFCEAFLAGYLFFWIITIFKLFSSSKKLQKARQGLPYKPLILSLILIHFISCFIFSRHILGATPHISDSAIYYRQAVLISQLKTKTDSLPAKPYQAFLSNSSFLEGDKIIYRHANRFWPAMIAPFMKLGIPDILNPLLSSLGMLSIFLFCSMVFDKNTGLLAATIYSFSPFVIINAGDFMMHVAAHSLFIGGLCSLIYALKFQKPLFSLLAGVIIAYAFGIRQLSILALSVPAFLFIYRQRLKLSLKDIIYFLSGSAIIAVLFVLDNYYLTGEWFVLAHKKFHNLSTSLNHLQAGSNWTDANLGSFPQIFFGSYLPQLSLGFITLPLLLKRNLTLWIMFLFFPALTLAHLLIPVHGLHGYGPRFLFESMFTPCILAGCGILYAYQDSGRIAKAIFTVFLLAYFSQNAYLAFRILPHYANYNGIYGARVANLRATASTQTIYVMDGTYWQSMDQAVSIFDPTFKENIIISKESPDYEKIIEAFPEWKVIDVSYIGKLKQRN